MIRQEKRRLTREIDKEVKWIWQKSPLTKIMKSKPFNSLTKEDMEQLEKGEFPHPEVQKDYNTVKDLMLRLRELKEEREFLWKDKKNVSGIQ